MITDYVTTGCIGSNIYYSWVGYRINYRTASLFLWNTRSLHFHTKHKYLVSVYIWAMHPNGSDFYSSLFLDNRGVHWASQSPSIQASTAELFYWMHYSIQTIHNIKMTQLLVALCTIFLYSSTNRFICGVSFLRCWPPLLKGDKTEWICSIRWILSNYDGKWGSLR